MSQEPLGVDHLLKLADGTLPLHPDGCILCRRVFPKGAFTKEHLFPKWLQHRFNLFDKTITLQNGSSIPYRQLTVAACNDCNNVHLKRLEDIVKAAVEGGYSAVKRLPRGVLMMWLSKILIGLILKECELLVDRRDASKGFILTPEDVRRFSLLNFHLQLVRTNRFWNLSPNSSVLVFRCKCPESVDEQFDFFDFFEAFNRKTASACMRLGEAGLACHFFDLEYTDNVIAEVLRSEARYALHPSQFREIGTRFMYKASLLQMEVGLDLDELRNGVRFRYVASGAREYGNWKNEEYAQVLGQHLELPPERLFDGKRVMTWLMDDSGRLVDMPLSHRIALP